MKPNPLELLNHFTVPCTSPSLLNRDFEISHLTARCITLTPLKIRIAQCTRIEVRVNRTFFFYSKDKFALLGAQNRFNKLPRLIDFAGRGTGNKRVFRQWTWRLAVSRRGSSPPVAYGYKHAKLFSHPLRVPLRPRSGLPREE